MKKKVFKDYPNVEHISKDTIDSNSSLAKMLNFIGYEKYVIDFGCATGYFAKLLSENKCTVIGVEMNPDAAKQAEKYCKQVITADLDYESLDDILASQNQKFDVAIFGDVLEHLKDPWSLLNAVKKILSHNGYVVASVPNIAHGSIRLALLEGNFDYEELGLLDNTHLRFFTHKSLYHLFESSGFYIESEESVVFPIFNDSPLTPHVNQDNFSKDIVEFINNDIYTQSLQFVVRAYPWSMAHENSLLRQQLEEASKHKAKIQSEFRDAQLQLQEAKSELQQVTSELQQVTSELQQVKLESLQDKQLIDSMKNRKFWNFKEKFLKIID